MYTEFYKTGNYYRLCNLDQNLIEAMNFLITIIFNVNILMSLTAYDYICLLTECEGIQLETFAAYINYNGMSSIALMQCQIVEPLSIKDGIRHLALNPYLSSY